MTYEEVVHFWFDELEPKSWWIKDETLDTEIRQRFSVIHAAAARCECYPWREQPLGRLAEIIVLDQFSRNIYRDQPLAFATDALSLALAQEAVALQVDKTLTPTQKAFLYVPYMHSESAAIHEIAVILFDQTGMESNLAFELKHKTIIDRFGRYPHRNEIMGRTSTPEEIAFLQQPGSSF
jgi:uncharacterized protein (DUF924 family)